MAKVAIVFNPRACDQEQDQHDYEALLGGREDKEIEEALHLAA